MPERSRNYVRAAALAAAAGVAAVAVAACSAGPDEAIAAEPPRSLMEPWQPVPFGGLTGSAP